jgi:hypothetical protein
MYRNLLETGCDYNAGICKEWAVAYVSGKCTQKCRSRYMYNCNYLSRNKSTGDCVQCKKGWFGSKRCQWQYREVSRVWSQLVLRTLWWKELQILRCKFLQQTNWSLLAVLYKLVRLHICGHRSNICKSDKTCKTGWFGSYWRSSPEE